MKIEKFIFNPFHENTYLVYDEVTKDAVVIDCGCYTQKEKNTLLSFINQHQLTIKYVLNTHLHIDHIFGNKFLFSQFGIEPQAHKGDIELLERMQEQALAFGLSLKEKEQPIGNFIDEKNSLTIGESSIQFIHVPGHSLGSLCIYFPKEKWLFSGDVLSEPTFLVAIMLNSSMAYTINCLFYLKRQEFLQVTDLKQPLVTNKKTTLFYAKQRDKRRWISTRRRRTERYFY